MKHKIRKKVESMIITAVIFMLIPVSISGIKYSIAMVTPTSYWMEYEYIIPEKLLFENGEDIFFSTRYNIKRPFNFEAVHTLYCNIAGNDDFSSSQVNIVSTSDIKEKIKKGWNTGRFQWHSGIPVAPKICYLSSTISNADVKGKEIVIKGEPFNIE